MRFQKSILNISVLILMLLPGTTAYAADFNDLQAYGVDTIAGYSTVITTSKTFPNHDVIISVKKPSGGVVNIPTKTDQYGIAKVDLYDYHTRRAGSYMVSARLVSAGTNGNDSIFKVYPDEVSIENSTIVAQKSVARADGNDKVYVTVALRDQYGNPYSGHVINLISSRQSDNIITSSADGSYTDVNGNVTFSVSSYESGVSVFSAVDSTSGMVLSSRAQVAFLKGSSYVSDMGGYLDGMIPVASAQSAGPLNKFEISDLPASIKPNENISFRTTAQDQNGLTVENYTGEVHFSAEGANSSNVALPEDYTFKAEDLGTHEFSLGLKFTVAGNYKIVVTDVNNQLIKGSIDVVVGSSSTTGTSSGDAPTITAPVAGTYSQNVQTVGGKSGAGMNINIFDNDQEIGSTQTDSSGAYSYQTSPLSDGEHSIYVVSLDSSNSVKGTSDTVIINVDTTPPAVDEITLTPSTGIKPGDIISANLMSEDNLSEAAIIFNFDIFELSPSLEQAGYYVASLQAPSAPGEYPIDVLLVDELGNEATYQSVATVSVTEAGGDITMNGTENDTTSDNVDEEVEDTSIGTAPSQVFGVLAYGTDKRVTLVWEAANDDGNIIHYRIKFGVDPTNLDGTIDTIDAATSWYIPNLENGKEYYFAVSAVDDTGLESESMSQIVSAIPFTLEIETALTDRPAGALDTGEEEALLRGVALDGRVPPELSDEGPELLWLLFGTGLLSGVSRMISKKNK